MILNWLRRKQAPPSAVRKPHLRFNPLGGGFVDCWNRDRRNWQHWGMLIDGEWRLGAWPPRTARQKLLDP